MRSTRDRAQNLRRNQTDTERKLWTHLRASRFKQFKFRRQHPIGPFIADFCCPSRGLVIELDGGQHDSGAPRDAQRTHLIEAQGYRVIRFWDSEVTEEMESLLARVLEALQRSIAIQKYDARGDLRVY